MSYSRLIHSLFEEQVQSLKGEIAVIDGVESLSYEELNAKANQLAHYLQKSGVRPGMVVALCMERSAKVLITIMAILKAGAAYVPLDSNYPKSRLDFILNDNHLPLLITDNQSEELFKSYRGKHISFNDNLFNTESKRDLKLNLNDSNLAYIIYTSGSTGVPKGVLIEHRSVVHYCNWFAALSRYKNKKNIDFSANYIFDMAITSTLVPLTLGLTIHICSDKIKKNARPYLKFLAKQKINLIKITPSYFKLLIQEIKNSALSLPHLKMLVIGGENLSTIDCATWLTHYPKHQIINEYGPTEATVAVLNQVVTSKNISSFNASVPIGKPNFKMPCYILNEALEPVHGDEIGEIYIGGRSLAHGYLNQKELTASKFIKNPFNSNIKSRLYKTGDLGRFLKNGSIEYLGRIDEQVKIRGFRVEPAEIEKQILGLQAIKDVVVIPQDNHLHEKYLIAYYIKKDKSAIFNSADIKTNLESHLPSHMIPNFFIEVESFPLTSNGKIDKKALPEPQSFISKNFIAAKSDIELILSKIWSEELDIGPIGIEDDFFELGGHSLSAARIISRINNFYGIELFLHQLYKYPTITQLSIIINKESKKDNLSIKKDDIVIKTISHIALGDFQLTLWLADLFAPKAKRFNIVSKKRFEGELDILALEKAFNLVLKKHEILSYKVSSFRPIMALRKNIEFQLMKKDLCECSEIEQRQQLDSSISNLSSLYPWPPKEALLKALLFKIKENCFELHLGLPHIISDDFSADIIFNDLTYFYNKIVNKEETLAEFNKDWGYQNYLMMEDKYQHQYIDRDLIFWQEYLKNACLYSFPQEYVIHDMKEINYSTYVEVPESHIRNLKEFCLTNYLSLNTGLVACFLLALAKVNIQPLKNNLFVNLVKSARNDALYDNSIGAFLRLEPLKIKLKNRPNLLNLAKQLHRSMIEVRPYQRTFGLLKLASLPFYSKNSFKSKVISAFSSIYTKIFRKPKLNREVLRQAALMTPLKANNEFFIMINAQTSFMTAKKMTKNFLGLNEKISLSEHIDLLSINNIFDLCFMRKEDGKAYIVISANLKSDFREKLALQIIEMMLTKVTEPIVAE